MKHFCPDIANSVREASKVMEGAALGYSQVLGVDFSENYAPVVDDITMRIMLVLKIANGWIGETIDVETAFLYGNLTKKNYTTIPNRLEAFINQQLSVSNKQN